MYAAMAYAVWHVKFCDFAWEANEPPAMPEAVAGYLAVCCIVQNLGGISTRQSIYRARKEGASRPVAMGSGDSS